MTRKNPKPENITGEISEKEAENLPLSSLLLFVTFRWMWKPWCR